MDTDEDNHESSSEDDMALHQDPIFPEVHPLQDDEAMDTAADEPHAEAREEGANHHPSGHCPHNPAKSSE